MTTLADVTPVATPIFSHRKCLKEKDGSEEVEGSSREPGGDIALIEPQIIAGHTEAEVGHDRRGCAYEDDPVDRHPSAIVAGTELPDSPECGAT